MTWPLGIATGGQHDRPILDVLRLVESAGFTGVEIGTPPHHFDPWQPSEVEAVHENLDASGVRALSIHAPFGGILDLSESNPQHRHAAIGGIVQAATVLQRLGGTTVVVHPTDVPRTAGEVSGRIENSTRALVTLAGVCRRMGLRLAVETPLPHLIGGQPDEFTSILEKLEGDVGVCLDTSHLWLGGLWDEMVRLVGHRVIHVHASDNRGTYDDHLTPGDGIIPWDRVAGSLHEAGFAGTVILEITFPGVPKVEDLQRARQVGERWFG